MTNNFEFFTMFKDNIKDILYIIGAVVGFFLGRKVKALDFKKKQVNVKTSELENVEQALKIYRIMLDDLRVKLKEAETAYVYIENKHHKVIIENRELSVKNQILKDQLNNLS